jgi:hypothetical protein
MCVSTALVAFPRLGGVLRAAVSLAGRLRAGAALNRSVPAAAPPLALAPVSRLYNQRPVLVASHLAMLQGPGSGTVTLPVSLQWSGDGTATVLREAGEPGDLQAWLNAGLLVELWPRLVLPRSVRAAWEEQHPVLSEAGAARRLARAS